MAREIAWSVGVVEVEGRAVNSEIRLFLAHDGASPPPSVPS